MAETDWSELGSSLSSGNVARGVTAGLTPPNGGGSFVYGFNSLSATLGAVGKYVNATGNPNFAPMQTTGPVATGGSVRGALQRGVSAEPQIGFSPTLFMHVKSGITASPDVNDVGYLLGLEDANPHRIVLRKGSLAGGLTVDTTQSTLRVSAASYVPGTWLHLRLDCIFNLNGDVILKVFQNDLNANTVGAPIWTTIPGMTDFVDDTLSVNSGSAPLRGGFCGYGFFSKDLQRRSYFDQIELLRQL